MIQYRLIRHVHHYKKRQKKALFIKELKVINGGE